MQGKNVLEKLTDILSVSCQKFYHDKFPGTSFPENVPVHFQIPKDARHGDLAANVAMRLSSVAKMSPKDLAEGIIPFFLDELKKTGLSEHVSNVEFQMGFINVRLSDAYFHSIIHDIHRQKDGFGRTNIGAGGRVNLEYVSANPTGPLTVAHGRQAAIGDALSRILSFNGYSVTNEYYLNDMGRQINLLGQSVKVRYRNLFGNDESLPEDGYQGEYINDIAIEIKGKHSDKFLKEKGGAVLSVDAIDKFFKDYAVEYMMKLIVTDLDDFGVKFDVWTSQAEFEGKKKVEKVLALLEEKGFIYEQEGAKWFASTRFGDDKDRVVVKSDGAFTYLAPDIAYHLDKYNRGFTKLIDLLGPDHHGYINRMKAAVQALGYSANSLDILIVQLVTLMKGGETLSMSTRKAEFISLRELLDELGKDVTRFFFLSRRLDSHLDFDIDLAKKESSDNPVYYMQYAHARVCSIKKFSKKSWFTRLFPGTNLSLLTAKEEKALIRKLSEFPFVVVSSAEALDPNRLLVYLSDLARSFHSFYTECRVVTDDPGLSKARLFLVDCVRIVLANGLGLLNVTLPEKM